MAAAWAPRLIVVVMRRPPVSRSVSVSALFASS
jgi:hypothetical protein